LEGGYRGLINMLISYIFSKLSCVGLRDSHMKNILIENISPDFLQQIILGF